MYALLFGVALRGPSRCSPLAFGPVPTPRDLSPRGDPALHPKQKQEKEVVMFECVAATHSNRKNFLGDGAACQSIENTEFSAAPSVDVD